MIKKNQSLVFDESIVKMPATIDNEHESYLTQFKDELVDQYTVVDLDKVNENVTDIDKYSVKRIEANPIKDRAKEMDHLCFVELFPYGTGGMYDDRPHPVKPAMFVKALIQNANPIARRNIQFLFSTVHNKDIRAADSGIYASLHTSKMPYLNAADLKNKISNKNRELEANLATTLCAVRGSKEYWHRKCSDLNTMDQRFNTANWFLTTSFSEYNDEDLHNYLIQMNSDIPNVDHYSLDKLIHLDPVSVSNYFEKKFRSFFNHIINNENGPLSRITHYFWRREYQLRGNFYEKFITI